MQPERLIKLPFVEHVISKEKGLESALRAQKRIRALGGESRIAQGEDCFIDWKKVFEQSILGLRTDPPYEVDLDALTPKERELLKNFAIGIPFEIAVVSDIDGVLVSPAHDWKRSGSMDLITLSGFRELLDASDSLHERTSRNLLSKEALEKSALLRRFTDIFKDKDYRFPFIDQQKPLGIDRTGIAKLTITHKQLFKDDENFIHSLGELSASGAMIYCFISSKKDREKAIRLLTDFPHLAEEIVFFDTGHVYL